MEIIEDTETHERHTRPLWRCYLKPGSKMIDYFKDRSHQVILGHQLSETLENPFEKKFGTIDAMNVPQQTLQKKLDNKLFERFQYVSISAPCAAGKTLMGLQMIHHLKLKTLIISARTAIKEQWMKEIYEIWPEMNVLLQSSDSSKKLVKSLVRKIDRKLDKELPKKVDKELSKELVENLVNKLVEKPDIWIMSPQFLRTHLNEETFKNLQEVHFVIFDEIHSMCGGAFSKCFEIFRLFSHPIYMCGLSATFPKNDSEDGMLLTRTFGIPIQLTSEAIVSRKVFVYDFREKEPNRGNIDQNWRGFTIKKVIDKVCEGLPGIPRLETFEGHHKFLCVSEEVKDSIKCCQMISQYFNSLGIPRKVVVVRESSKGCFLVDCQKVPLKDFNEEWIVKNCQRIHMKDIDDSDACGVFGCNARLKEGINIKTLVFGISTNFDYSISFRIQILGRIRRTDENIKRFFVVNPGRAPNNSKYWNGRLVKHPTKITYPFEYEAEEFAKNGIERI